MEWKEYIENHSTIIKNSQRVDISESILKNFSEIEQSKKRGNFILRQEINSLTIFCTFKVALFINIFLFLVFNILGIYIVLSSENIKEYSIKYDNCKFNTINQKICEIDFSLNETFYAPVNLFYQLSNFYSNHREYVRSRSWPQLGGQKLSTDSVRSRCEKMLLNSDLLKKSPSITALDGSPLSPSSTLNPCGLVSANYFSDKFQLDRQEAESDNNGANDEVTTPVEIDRNNITYAIDREYFKKLPADQNEAQWIDVEDEGFIVWMSMETFSNFRKKWGKINTNLEPGQYKLTIEYNWDYPNYDTQKHFLLMSGVENTFHPFFGYSLIVAGGIIFMITLVLIYNRFKNKSNFNANDLKWR